MFLNQIEVYANKIEDWMKMQPMQISYAELWVWFATLHTRIHYVMNTGEVLEDARDKSKRPGAPPLWVTLSVYKPGHFSGFLNQAFGGSYYEDAGY
jgi:hypothetical protein